MLPYPGQGQGPHLHLLHAVNIARLKFFITVLLPRSLPSLRLFFSLVGSTHIHVLGDGAQMLGFPCLNGKDPRTRRIYEDGDTLHILRDEMDKCLVVPLFVTMRAQRSNEDQAVRISKSIFVTNFPDNPGSKELFIRVNDLDRLVGNLCTIWIGRFHLHANVARFERANKPVKALGPSQSNAHGTFGSFVSAAKDFPPLIAFVAPVSSSSALVLDDSCVVERDLSCYVMGRVKDINSIPNLRILLAKEGFEHVKLSYLVSKRCCLGGTLKDHTLFGLEKRLQRLVNNWGEALDIEDNFGSLLLRFEARSEGTFLLGSSFLNLRRSVYTSDDEIMHGAKILNDGAQNSDVESDVECNVVVFPGHFFSDNGMNVMFDGHGKE
ncbi:hypothetical protein Tco_0678636 [Tanacetum coccineum]|uniref:Uncharacterized protein n=1 Tax=Tanacetum coccineum TaxID=301880 RepID=A0ABQ4XG73_9ASTR